MSYMCNVCFKAYDVEDHKCCKGGELFQIDEEMVPIIRVLNHKGYKTAYCCSGHTISYPMEKYINLPGNDFESTVQDMYVCLTGKGAKYLRTLLRSYPYETKCLTFEEPLFEYKAAYENYKEDRIVIRKVINKPYILETDSELINRNIELLRGRMELLQLVDWLPDITDANDFETDEYIYNRELKDPHEPLFFYGEQYCRPKGIWDILKSE